MREVDLEIERIQEMLAIEESRTKSNARIYTISQGIHDQMMKTRTPIIDVPRKQWPEELHCRRIADRVKR